MTEYIHEIAVFCPEAKMADANQLAGATAESLADVNTYRVLNYKDAAGNRYAVIHTVVRQSFLDGIDAGKAGYPIPRPDYDSEETLDLTAAQRALDSVVIYTGTEQATPNTILAIIDIDPQQAIQLAGVELIEENI